nr:lipase 1-like [Danaus plexippus plexippus]
MKLTVFFIFSVVATVLQSDIILGKNDLLLEEDARLDFMGLATKYGHPAVRHQVTTDDGYILTLFHIPGRSKLPVLLMHDLLDTADTFLLRGNDSLGIALANSGYDLWFGNCRGNRYSRRHRDLDPNRDSSYWSFTFHEMGYYDLPAIIDRVLNETGTPSLTAIGHSRGNTIFFVLGSTRPEYNSKTPLLSATFFKGENDQMTSLLVGRDTLLRVHPQPGLVSALVLHLWWSNGSLRRAVRYAPNARGLLVARCLQTRAYTGWISFRDPQRPECPLRRLGREEDRSPIASSFANMSVSSRSSIIVPQHGLN